MTTRRIPLEGAPWLASPLTQRVLASLTDAGFAARVVGGAVRNALLGEPVNDIDIATTARPDQVIAVASAAGFAVVPTGLAHGTVTVVVAHQPFEVTTLRRDIATDGRRATVAFTDDWLADAGRRDFTINALSCDADGVIHDPVGGLADVAARRVRFIGDPEARIREDYLRILRLFRFSARYGGGAVDAIGLAAAIRLRQGLAGLSGERVRAELLQIVVAPAAEAMVTIMAEAGFVDRLSGCVGHLARFARVVRLEAAAGLPADPLRRLAALLLSQAEDAARLTERLKLSGDERQRLADMAVNLERPAGRRRTDDRVEENAMPALLYRRGVTAVRDRLILDHARDGDDEQQLQPCMALTAGYRRPQFPLSGRHLIALGATPGPAIGAALLRLENDWIATGFSLSAEALLARDGLR